MEIRPVPFFHSNHLTERGKRLLDDHTYPYLCDHVVALFLWHNRGFWVWGTFPGRFTPLAYER